MVVVCKKIIRYQPHLLHTASGAGAAGVRLHCPPVVGVEGDCLGAAVGEHV